MPSVSLAIAIYLAGSIALTWPLATHMSDATPSAYRDSRHIVWLLAWDAHVLKTDPTNLFQAPHFWPERDVLTYTDHIIGLGILAAPVIWATGNPYLGHNIVFVGSIVFSGLAAFLLCFELTRRRGAALVGGAAFAFAPYWFGPIINLSHLQTLASGWIPLSLFGLVRWVRSGAWRDLILLAGAFVMATLTSWYQSMFLLLAIVVSTPFLLWSARPVAWRRLILQGMIGAVVAGALIAPFALPYRRPQERFSSYTRRLDEAENFSARASSYLSAPPTNVLYGGVTERWQEEQRTPESTLFPGVLVVALAAVGVASIRRARLPAGTFAGFAAVGLTGIVLAFGGGAHGIRRYLPWTFLFEHVIFFRGLRAPARVHVLTLVLLSFLAALGTARLLDHISRRATLRAAVALSLVAVIALEGSAVPIALGAAPRAPRGYAALASRPGAILELPTGFHVPGSTLWSRTRTYDVDYMLFGTAHWRPLVNGFSSFEPPAYARFMDAMATLPDETSLALLRRNEVRTLVVHTDRVRGTPWAGLTDKLARTRGVTLMTRTGRVLIYDIAKS